MELLEYSLSDNIVSFSTKRGGPHGNYGEFNITHYCGDTEEHVNQCRVELCNKLGISDNALILPRQTHESNILNIDKSLFSLCEEVRNQKLYGIDAVVTTLSRVCIGVSTADCVPVLLYDEYKGVIAAIHAGWRGTLQKIVEKTVNYMIAEFSTSPKNIKAVIGPSIRVDAFEVGDEVYERFKTEGFEMDKIAERRAKWHIDLLEANRNQLVTCGVNIDNIHISGICTYTNHQEFFSARRLGINSGRIFNGIMIK